MCAHLKVLCRWGVRLRGTACLLQPYSDQKNWNGFLLSSQKHFQDVAKMVADKGFQLCTHAIGDSVDRGGGYA